MTLSHQIVPAPDHHQHGGDRWRGTIGLDQQLTLTEWQDKEVDLRAVVACYKRCFFK